MLHEELIRALKKSVAEGDVFQAVIFEGPEGIGKRTLARMFAEAIHCESDGDKPCGTCPSCIKHKTGNHPDYFELVPEKGKKNISVSAVRSACEELFVKPFTSDKKILFIPEAELCEAPAQNAMLKCFEEPPHYAVIILAVKDLSALLDTIKSRAAIFSVPPASDDEIKAFVRENFPDMASSADFIAAFSGGIVKKAIMLSQSGESAQKRRAMLSLLSELSKSRLKALAVSDFITDNIDDEELLFELMLTFLRDAAAVKCQSTDVINSDFLPNIKAFAAENTKSGIVHALSLAAYAKNEKSKNANYGLFIADLVIRLWEVLHG